MLPLQCGQRGSSPDAGDEKRSRGPLSCVDMEASACADMEAPVHLSAPDASPDAGRIVVEDRPLRISPHSHQCWRRFQRSIASTFLVGIIGETVPGVGDVKQHGPLGRRSRGLREPDTLFGPFSVVGGAAHGFLRFVPRMTETYAPSRSITIVQSLSFNKYFEIRDNYNQYRETVLELQLSTSSIRIYSR